MEFYYDEVDENVLILSVDGGLMADNAHRLVGELESYIELGIDRLIVDCARLTRISSYGLGILISLHKRMARKGGDVKLAAVSGLVGNVIRMTGLGMMLEIYATVDDARLAFAPAGGSRSDARRSDSKHPHLPRDPGEGS